MSNVIMALSSVVVNAVPGLPAGTGSPAPTARPIAEQAVRPLAVAAVISAAALLRRHYLQWGATRDEQQRHLCGDDLLPVVDLSATRAITIEATAAAVWPWLAQLGQGRGGFYSYDWLENVVAHIDIHNADHIVPEWQRIEVGSEVRLAPELALTVAALEPGRAVVLQGNVPMGEVAPPYEFTWTFALFPQSDGTTRLVVRERYSYTRRWASLIVQPASLVSCVMSPKMLRGIKVRVERTPMPDDARPERAAVQVGRAEQSMST